MGTSGGFIRKMFATAAILLAFSSAASPDDLADSRKKRSSLERDIAILKREIAATSSQSNQALSTLSLIQAQQSSRRKVIADTDRKIRGYDNRMVEIQREINRQQRYLDTLQTHYYNLVAGAYKNRDVKIWYMYILGSENLSQAFRRFGYFKSLSSQINTQARQIENTRASLSEKYKSLKTLKDEASAVRARKASELTELNATAAQQKKLVSSLKKNVRKYRASLKEKQKEKRILDSKIATMIQQAAAGQSKSKKKSKPVDYALAASFEANKGKLPWPVEGPVAEHYGAFQNKELKLSLFNNGINIACDPHSQVKAVFDGVVSNIMIAPGYGNCILVQHGNYYTTYCKVKSACVKQGDKVKTGQVIGEVATILGKTQLYFLVWKKAYLDPEDWLRER